VHDNVETAIFNHSNRVYYLGAVLVQDYLPQWKFNEETYFLTSLFHDIGTASHLQLSSVLSFEFIGGIHAREKLMEFGAPQVQADEVAEAIFRHTDARHGNTRHAGQIIQMSTGLDVLGVNPQWFNPSTVDQVVKKYPRLGFNHLFADQMRLEIGEKPGCLMCTRDTQEFIKRVENNPVMAPYDN
jgi:cyanamide hydratase